MPNDKSRRGAVALLARSHDALSHAGFVLGVLALAVIVVLFSYEIVARYFFRAPTRWVSDYVAYALLISTFLLLPQLTRARDHISITFLQETMPVRLQFVLSVGLGLFSGLVCFAAAYLCGLETWRQYTTGTRTMAVVSIPKWWVSIFIVYGLFNTGLYFLRLAAADILRGGPPTVTAPGAD
jgi:TRAP-type C4-dicarboxylate transport system permease small subunit